MERETCTGTRKGKECGGALFKCGHCGALGCEKSGCDNRQFKPIERCNDCGRSYERLKQFKASAAPVGEAGSGHAGRPISLPSIEFLFGGALLFTLAAAILAGMMGLFGPRSDRIANADGPAPIIAAADRAPLTVAYADVCQCYRGGMDLADKGATVLDSTYRVGFVQCRAAFGSEGGEAWTAGWNARSEGRLIGAGCRSWRRGFGQ